MEIEENCIDEMLDLNPLDLAEIYSLGAGEGLIMSSDQPSSSSSSSPRLISFDTSAMVDYNSNLEIREKKDFFLSSQILNFESTKNPNPHHDHVVNGVTRKWASTPTRTLSQAQDHLMAERKRRQNLSQLFITLSKVVPGLTKLDKASLLEDAINYLKALQERVSDLEREEMRKSSRDNSCLYEENIGGTSKSRDPEISVRIAERHVLVKIQCKKQSMEVIMARIPREIEKMNMNAIDIRMMPFGGEALDITILAESKYGGTVKDIINVDHLEAVFMNLCG